MATPAPAIQFQGGQNGSALPAQGTPEYNALISAQNAGVSGAGNFNPDTKEVTVMSTNGGQKTLADAVTAHQADMAATAAKTNTTTDPNDATASAMKAIGGVTADEAKAAGIDLSGYSYDAGSKYFLPNNGSKAQQDQFSTDKRTISDAFSTQIANLDAAGQALVQAIGGIYDSRMQEQRDVNMHELAAVNTINIRGGADRYAPGVANSIFTAEENAGLARLTKIATEQANAIATAQSNLQDKKYKAFMDNRAEVQKLTTDYKATLKDLHDKAITAAKEQRDNIKAVQDKVVSIAQEAAKNGASPDIVKAISGSKTISDALNAAGNTLQTAPGEIGEYLFYKNNAQAQGKTAMNFADYLAYKAGLKNGGTGVIPDPSTDTSGALGGGKQGGSILTQTGLSLPAFNFITQGTAALTRMTAGQRQQYMSEAQKFLNSKGIDVSTFQSQYKAYNDVLTSNITRFNKTKIMEDEVLGTADNVIKEATDADMKKLAAINLADLWAGKQLNDPTAQKYRFQLQSMRNDLAGYFAAARGANAPELQDMEDAQKVIGDGINAGSTKGFKEAVQDNAEKMKGVLERSVDSARKSVWGMFGVGDKYQSINPANAALDTSKSEVSTKIGTALQSGYSEQDIVTKLVSDPSIGSKIQAAMDQGISAHDIILYLQKQ